MGMGIIPQEWEGMGTTIQSGTNDSWSGAHWRRGPHTMVQPVQWLIWHRVQTTQLISEACSAGKQKDVSI